MQAPEGTKFDSRYSNSATCSKLPPSENSEPAVFSMRIRRLAARQVQAVHALLDGQRGALQAVFPAAAAKRSGMQHQKFGAQRQCAFHLAAKCRNRFGMKFGIAAGDVDQIVGVNDQRLQIVLLTQTRHLFALRAGQLVRLPLARAGGKNLKRVAAQAIGAFGGVGRASCGRRVNADAPRSELGRPLGRGQQLEDVFFFFGRFGHDNILCNRTTSSRRGMRVARLDASGSGRLASASALGCAQERCRGQKP